MPTGDSIATVLLRRLHDRTKVNGGEYPGSLVVTAEEERDLRQWMGEHRLMPFSALRRPEPEDFEAPKGQMLLGGVPVVVGCAHGLPFRFFRCCPPGDFGAWDT